MPLFDQTHLRRFIGCPDVAIDLGTANTRVFATGYGMIADEPSMVSLAQDTGAIAAVGREAERLSATGQDYIRQPRSYATGWSGSSGMAF